MARKPKYPGVTESPTGWVARPYRNGKRLPSRSFPKTDEGQREAWEWKCEQEGKGGTQATTDETIAQFFERWPRDFPLVKKGLRKGLPKTQKTIEGYTNNIKPLLALYGELPIDGGLTPQMAQETITQHPRAAEVAKGMFADACRVRACRSSNPYLGLMMPSKGRGRRDHSPLTRDELTLLADCSIDAHRGQAKGQYHRAFILFTGTVGNRLGGGMGLRWEHLRPADWEVDLTEKGEKKRTVILPPEAWAAIERLPRHTHGFVFVNRSGGPLKQQAHQQIWVPIRDLFLEQLTPERRAQIVGFGGEKQKGQQTLTFHHLRHAAGSYLYNDVRLPGGGRGLRDEQVAYQLGHEDAKLVRDLYGHGRDRALEQMKADLGLKVAA